MFNKGKTKFAVMGAIALLLLISAASSPVWYDDAGHYIVAREFAEQGKLCYPVSPADGICDPASPFITMGPAMSIPGGIWMGIFGTTMFSIRCFMVLLSLGLLIALLFLSNNLFDNHAAAKGIATTLLIGGNIQFLTYGAEFLGEVPMLLFLFIGFVFFVKLFDPHLAENNFLNAFAAGLFWLFAILCKEYIALPLGISLIAGGIAMAFARKWALTFSALLILLILAIGDLAWHFIQSGSFSGMMDFLESRRSYGSEFFAFNPGEALRFLLFKPLFWLGTLALFMKIYFRRDGKDIFFAGFHLVHVAFFMASAGYDRFGFQLLFIPALYLSEFIVATWTRIRNNRQSAASLTTIFVILFLLLFTQKSFITLSKRVSGYESNVSERRVNEMLYEKGIYEVYTFDQQLVPFFDPDIRFRLNPTVPSASQECEPINLRPGEILIAGPYAFTEFPTCVNWNDLQMIASTGDSAYQFFAKRPE